MSFVTTVPELIEAAAADLAGIGSTVGAASAAAAPSTTSLLAAAEDEVSAAVAALFGRYGQEFQALTTRVEAFHDEFVRQLNAGAAAYAGAEAANAGQAASALTDIAGPYQRLFANTGANLQKLDTAIRASGAPLLNQFITNQTGYAQTVVAGIESVIQNFPANVPVAIQNAIRNLAGFDPVAFLRWFVNNQIGYAQTIGSALQNSAASFVEGLRDLPGAFQSAFQALQTGDIGGAVNDVLQGFAGLFYDGFDVTNVGSTYFLTPAGALGDLLPILTVPGQIAQDFTYTLPAGSILQQMSQNLTNVIDISTDTTISANIALTVSPLALTVTNFYGLPMALLIDAVGAPMNGLLALENSVTAISTAVQVGDWSGAIGGLVTAPAVIADGFLNGEYIAPLQFYVGNNLTSVNLPLNGLLVPVSPYTASMVVPNPIPIFPPITLTVPVGGTPVSGLLPGLFVYLPQQLANAIG